MEDTRFFLRRVESKRGDAFALQSLSCSRWTNTTPSQDVGICAFLDRFEQYRTRDEEAKEIRARWKKSQTTTWDVLNPIKNGIIMILGGRRISAINSINGYWNNNWGSLGIIVGEARVLIPNSDSWKLVSLYQNSVTLGESSLFYQGTFIN